MSCPWFYNLARQQPTEPIDVTKDGGVYTITTRVPVEGSIRVLITCRGGETLIEVMAFGYYNYTTIKDCVKPISIVFRNYVLTMRLVGTVPPEAVVLPPSPSRRLLHEPPPAAGVGPRLSPGVHTHSPRQAHRDHPF